MNDSTTMKMVGKPSKVFQSLVKAIELVRKYFFLFKIKMIKFMLKSSDDIDLDANCS